ncbi:MAG: adenine phosphoribosyltransferase [Gemmatimonadota bacterium]
MRRPDLSPQPAEGSTDSWTDSLEKLANAVGGTVRDYPDFPRPGILFRDIAPVLAEPRLLGRIVAALSHEAARNGAELIAGIESRGFLIGTPVALELELPFVPIRKQGKLPGETVTAEYDLEYGSAHLELQVDSVGPGTRVVLIDDLLATGGTAAAAAGLIERLGGLVAGISFLIELEALRGREVLGRYNVLSLLHL